MITVIERQLNIPKNEKFIGCLGDNLVEQRQFEVPAEYSVFIFKLDIQIDTHKGNIPLTKLDDTDNIWVWDIKEEQKPCSGLVYANLSAFDSQDVQKWNTIAEPHFIVEKTVNADGEFAPLDPTGFRQIETHIANMKKDINEKASQVADNTQTVANNTKAVENKAAEASQSANEAAGFKDTAQGFAEESEKQATLSKSYAVGSTGSREGEDTGNAKHYKELSAQVYTAFNNAIGTTVPSLVGGKVPLSQIPATATHEELIVYDESELVTLVAQKGDIANLIADVNGEITVVKAWKLLGDDATVRSSWVVAGTSYAVQAGNALVALDSQKFNGHGVYTMEESE